MSFLEDLSAFSTKGLGLYFDVDIKSSLDFKYTFGEIMIQFQGDFQPIPLIAALVITVILSIFLNTLVAIYYRKAKTKNRPYVIALVVLDFMCVLFVLPLLVVVNIAKRNTFFIALERLRNEIGMTIFLLYLFPSFKRDH